MGTRRFLVVLLICLLGAAAALVAATTLDAPWLRSVAVGLVLGAFVAREIWQWRGDARGWVLMVLALGGVVLLGFVFQRLLG